MNSSLNHIYHFDVFNDFHSLLKGKKFQFPLNCESVKTISDKQDVEIITVKSSSKVSKDIISQFPNLKLVITRTVGLDHIEVEQIEKMGIRIENIPDYGAFGIAEHVFALLLTLTRKVIILDKKIKNGHFTSEDAQGFTLEGKTMGVIGAGRIGIEIIKLAQAFKMKVIAFDMYENQQLADVMHFSYVPLDELLSTVDIISLNVPLTEKTRHFIGEKEIKEMKDNIILINTSRGLVLDTQAIVDNIEKFKYVGLDVLEDESEFDVNHPLLQYENVIITPHCAYYTDKSTKLIADKTTKIIEDYYND